MSSVATAAALMKLHILTRRWLTMLGVATSSCITLHSSAGQYALAYWREAGAYENQAPPAGGGGNHSAYVHVWDESGQPLAGKQIYTSWGVLLGATDANGFLEIVLYRPNGYDFQVRDSSHLSDTTPVLSVERAPNWGRYSFEIGFLFKQQTGNPGVFDTNYFGVVNASGSDPCQDLSAPCTRSLAYYSTCPTNYCSDQYQLGTWTASHGQTFVATGNRVVALKTFLALGFDVHYYWTAQIYEDGPGGAPVGPPRSSRLMVDGEYFPILVKWALSDVQVVPGRTYYLRTTVTGGANVWRLNRNNYPGGNYYENDVSVPGAEMMGLVVCAGYTNAGPLGTLSGTVLDTSNHPLGGAVVTVPDIGLYATTAGDGSYTLPLVPAGLHDITATAEGYVAGLNRGVSIVAGLTNLSGFSLALVPTNSGTGIITNGNSILQPFETMPAWIAPWDAPWGSAATFVLEAGGVSGFALKATRTGPGSSVRALILPLRTNTPYALSVWMRCPSFSGSYWAECAFKPGISTAQDFDQNSTTWTYLHKFSDTGENGNGNAWKQYTVNLNSGANTVLTVGFKLGASSGTGPPMRWDQLAVVSQVLPALSGVVANSLSNLTVQFAEPVNEPAATNLAHYWLASGTNVLPALDATLVQATNLMLVSAPRTPRLDYTLTVSNVVNPLQPPTLTGRNGQWLVRVPQPLIVPDDPTLWRFEASGTDLGSAWRAPAYDDSAWPLGAALWSQAAGALPEPIRSLLPTATNLTTTYFRKSFTLPATVSSAWLRLRPVVADGAVFWLNGSELFRIGVADNPPLFSSRASRTVNVAAYEGPFDVAPSSLVSGTNVLAVEVHQSEPANAHLVFGTVLEALVQPSQLPVARPVLGVSLQPDGLSLTWGDTAWTLETATNLLGPWVPQPGATSPALIAATNSAAFFRLGEP
jgi:hypothetical protein